MSDYIKKPCISNVDHMLSLHLETTYCSLYVNACLFISQIILPLLPAQLVYCKYDNYITKMIY